MKRIDLGPTGPAGIEAKTWDEGLTRFLYIGGSDHWWDWLHHFLPGAKRREVAAARTLVDKVFDENTVQFIVGGHSLGGCIAQIVATHLQNQHKIVFCYTYGGKRPPVGHGYEYSENCRHRGDIVPYLPPWRYANRRFEVTIGRWTWPWLAHSPKMYYEMMRYHRLR